MGKLIFEKSKNGRKGYTLPKLDVKALPIETYIPQKFLRKEPLNLPEVSENEIVRHYIKMSTLNYHIDQGLYPLGSCTMKYNPKVNEKTASLPGFANLHPCSLPAQAQGALRLIYELGEYLKEITGLQGVSLQPAAGSQGEFTGIMMFRAYHLDKGDTRRNKILIPDSAHGTNPASSAMAGFQTVSIKSNMFGRIDIADLKSKAGDDVAGMMITNPNTLGFFEKEIIEIEKIVHGCGGLIYMDGANLNALLGIARPGDMKFDCVHINLHKTFSTPHGGGGPGSGPVCVNEKLIPFLPIPRIVKNVDIDLTYTLDENQPKSIGRVHSFFGNFGMFVRAYTYIRMYGKEGIRSISENAIINANYLLARLKEYYEVPFDDNCMHEFVLSANQQKKNGVVTKDIAKRLLDYGFHAPTIYFPLIVSEAMLIEPTETESKESLDAFADAMIAIAKEAQENPEIVINAPSNTPVKRLDDALAARNLNIRYESVDIEPGTLSQKII